MASFYFDKEAKRRINESVTAYDVVQILSVPTKKVGNRISILCPSPDHADANYGSCSIDINGNCYCYVCRKRFTPIDMMMGLGGYNLYDAVTVLAEYTGCQDEYIAKELPKADPLLLSRDERKFIGLSGYGRGYRIIGASESKPSGGKPYIVRGEEYLLIEYQNEGDPLKRLLEEEPEIYKRLVKDKIREKTELTWNYAREFGKDDPLVQKEYHDTIKQLKELAGRFAKKTGEGA